MAAAAVSSLACPLRRSSRLTSRRKSDNDDDDDNELTPRALRALKRQRLTLDLARPKRRRKENTPACCLPVDRPHKPDSPEPLTPLTPLSPSPSPEFSPSLPGHDRPISPPLDPPPSPAPPPPAPTPLPDHFNPPLDPTLDTLIPFDPHFPQDLISPPQPQPQPQPPLQPLDLHDQFHPFPQPQLYVPPPVFVRDREINIWKLACQERVDFLLRRYGIDHIKALVQSQARHSQPDTQTKFRLYTPASYTYSSSAWGSTSRSPCPLDDDDPDAAWPIDDADWVDADVDMEDDDEDDYEDDDDPDIDPVREGESTIDPAQPLVITDPPTPLDADPPPDPSPAPNSTPTVDPPRPPSPTEPRPLTSAPHVFHTPPTLPPLSSLHVPLLSEPPRAFMGRGTPPDRRRLIEWSSGRAASIGPPLYLSPVPQRTADDVPMAVDPPSNGEWTSFLFSVLEGDGVVGGTMATPTGPSWYELGLVHGVDLGRAAIPPGSVPPPESAVEEASSSTLRFALG